MQFSSPSPILFLYIETYVTRRVDKTVGQSEFVAQTYFWSCSLPKFVILRLYVCLKHYFNASRSRGLRRILSSATGAYRGRESLYTYIKPNFNFIQGFYFRILKIVSNQNNFLFFVVCLNIITDTIIIYPSWIIF